MGLYRHGRKLFVGVPRRGPGIPSTLNVIDLDSFDKLNPKLTGYPSYQTNELHPDLKPDPNRLVNVYRPRADSCNRLFVIDTGRIYFNSKLTMESVQCASMSWDISASFKHFARVKSI